MIFAGVLRGDKTEEKKLIRFLTNFTAGSSRNNSRAAESSYAAAKRGLGSYGLECIFPQQMRLTKHASFLHIL